MPVGNRGPQLRRHRARPPRGSMVTLRRSKTYQEGAGRKVSLPFGQARHCPVLSLSITLAFRLRERSWSCLPPGRPAWRRGHWLSGEGVSLVLKACVPAAVVSFSAHSLRAGFATSAVQACVSTLKIRAQTCHASNSMLWAAHPRRRVLRRQCGGHSCDASFSPVARAAVVGYMPVMFRLPDGLYPFVDQRFPLNSKPLATWKTCSRHKPRRSPCR